MFETLATSFKSCWAIHLPLQYKALHIHVTGTYCHLLVSDGADSKTRTNVQKNNVSKSVLGDFPLLHLHPGVPDYTRLLRAARKKQSKTAKKEREIERVCKSGMCPDSQDTLHVFP